MRHRIGNNHGRASFGAQEHKSKPRVRRRDQTNIYEPGLPGWYRPKTNPLAGMNQRADREISAASLHLKPP